MDDAKLQLADKLKNANNILVTVSRDPSVDQLSALLGLTLLLNKLNKHAAAVFSGQVPSTLEFLKPEETIEKNTDSLRDFIIALDKSKADKLRYKVENNIVRIFITPYRTSITQDDLEFSQGDFNVDVVVALGVHNQTDLDEAITAHGRILHDATVATINLAKQAELGGINWSDPTASSLSELVTELAQVVDKELIDGQIATALLTGIVAETNRFSNEKTTAQTMSASAALMAAGANQQLVATQLNEGGANGATAAAPAKPVASEPATDAAQSSEPKPEPGTLEINHQELPPPTEEPLHELPEAVNTEPEETDQEPEAPVASTEPPKNDHLTNGSRLITEPPTMGGTLSANVRPEALDPITDPLSLPTENKSPILNRDASAANKPAEPITPPPVKAPTIEPPKEEVTETPKPPEPVVLPEPEANDKSNQTLTDLEQSVHSPHADAQDLDKAREEVTKAFDAAAVPADNPPADNPPAAQELPVDTPVEQNITFDPAKFGITSDPTTPDTASPQTAPTVIDPNGPPPVPPPLFDNPNNLPH